jgi:hypothetical protein
MPHRKHNAPWTPADLKVMRICANKRMSARLAAKALGRTTGSVRYKAMVEGVHFRAINQKPGTQSRPSQRRKLSRLRKARAA